MYDGSGCGKRLRTQVVMMMGVWHQYKDANMLIWREFGYSFLGPLFHALYPGGKFFKKPRLTQALSLLSIVRLSYPSWRKQLMKLSDDPQLDRKLMGHVTNLVDLCEYFIPTVNV